MRKKRGKKRKYHCEKYDIFPQHEFQNHSNAIMIPQDPYHMYGFCMTFHFVKNIFQFCQTEFPDGQFHGIQMNILWVH